MWNCSGQLLIDDYGYRAISTGDCVPSCGTRMSDFNCLFSPVIRPTFALSSFEPSPHLSTSPYPPLSPHPPPPPEAPSSPRISPPVPVFPASPSAVLPTGTEVSELAQGSVVLMLPVNPFCVFAHWLLRHRRWLLFSSANKWMVFPCNNMKWSVCWISWSPQLEFIHSVHISPLWIVSTSFVLENASVMCCVLSMIVNSLLFRPESTIRCCAHWPCPAGVA